MTLIALVDASDAVAATSRRLEKIARLAGVLQAAGPEEVEAVVAFLSGAPRQGAINIGHAAISAASDVEPASTATLSIKDVDETFAALASIQGRGAARDRAARLRTLFALATRPERDFLRRLLYSELRHGALEGVLAEALAKAAGISADVVRRASMMAGDLATVARPALEGGASALSVISLQLMRPIQPMLAQSASSVDDALHELGAPDDVAF